MRELLSPQLLTTESRNFRRFPETTEMLECREGLSRIQALSFFVKHRNYVVVPFCRSAVQPQMNDTELAVASHISRDPFVNLRSSSGSCIYPTCG